MLEILCRHQCTYESLFAIFNGEKHVCFSQWIYWIILDLLDLIMDLLDHSGLSYENTWSYVTSIQWYKMAAGFFILQSDR